MFNNVVIDFLVRFAGDFIGNIGQALGEGVKMLAGVADGIIALLPDAADLNLPDLSGWLHGYAMLNRFIPVDLALVYFGLYLAAANASYLFNLGVKLYHLIPKPGIGT